MELPSFGWLPVELNLFAGDTRCALPAQDIHMVASASLSSSQMPNASQQLQQQKQGH